MGLDVGAAARMAYDGGASEEAAPEAAESGDGGEGKDVCEGGGAQAQQPEAEASSSEAVADQLQLLGGSQDRTMFRMSVTLATLQARWAGGLGQQLALSHGGRAAGWLMYCAEAILCCSCRST